LQSWDMFKSINGPAGQQLSTSTESFVNQLPAANFDLGIIAGTKTFNPILSLMLPNPDDGKVTLENTKVEGMKDFIALPVTHTFMMKNKKVIKQVLHFLKNGQFVHEIKS
jgi:protein involved in ribonucleotide reduction